MYWVSGIWLEPNKSYKEARIFQSGSLVQRELSVFTGTNGTGEPLFDLYQLYVYQNDSLGHATNIVFYDAVNSSINRTIYQADYKGSGSNDGELLLWETDESGTRTEYAYDSLKRKVSANKKGVSAGGGFAAQADITNTMRFDATGKLLERAVTSGSLALTNKQTYDIAGRSVTSTDEKGLVTSTLYELGGRRVTTTLPSGTTDVRENYLDRRLYTRTGTAVIQETHDYWQRLQDDPTNYFSRVVLQEKISYGPTGARWQKIGTDWFGFPVRKETPDYNTANSVVEYQFYRFNLGGPASIDKSGQPTRTLDRDFDGVIGKTSISSPTMGTDLASQSRITRTLKNFVKQGSAWFKVQTNFTYLIDNDATPTMTSISQERLSGFASSGTLSEVTTWDADTNATITTVTVDRANKKITQVTDPPQSTLNATNVTINGLLQWESTPTVASPTKHFYDGLGRETSVTSPLGFTASTAYDQFGQIISKSDFTGMSVSYDYYGNGVTGAGQLKSETRANGKKTYHSYTSRGELYRTWGDVPYPEERVYSDYGDLAELHTYRGGSGWSGSSWPASPGTADKTTWSFQAESGLLLSKTDDAGRSVSYTYTSGLLLTRTWARGVVTTNSYNDFADLAALTYSDSTPIVLFTNYNRAGLPLQIIDGSGTNNLAYDHASRVKSSAGGLGIYSGVTVSNHFSSIYGRDQIKITGLSSPIQQDYGYETYGRLGGVTNGVYSANYSYKPNSDLLSVTTCKSNSTIVLTTSRTWEFGRRLQNIVNTVNQSSTVCSYTYIYDALERRTQATLEDGSIWKYDYNDRDELISAKHFWPDWTPTAGQRFAYGFDNIGNRVSTLEGGDSSGAGLRPASYSANDLNQYTSRSVPNKSDVIGAAYATAAATVNNNATYRKGEYYNCAINANNDSGPAWLSVTNVASLSGSTNTITGNLLVPPTNQVFSYDADGNLTNDSVWAYLWDGENRLVQMSNLTTVANAGRKKLDLSYDSTGRRTQKIVSTSNGSGWIAISTNRFIYDGWNLLAVIDPLMSVLQSFTWGSDLSGTADKAGGIGGLLVASFYGGATTNCFAAYDGNGTVTALVNAADKSISARYEYDAFGGMIRSTGPLAHQHPFRFSTKFWDEESGLVYYGFRFYNPSTGRWISRDPVVQMIGLNLYQFVRNCPQMAVDPDGRFVWLLATMVIGGVVGYMTHPDDPWRGVLQGAAAGALGFGAGAIVGAIFGAGAVATTFAATTASVVSQYAIFAMDNYAANKNNWWVPSKAQALVMTAVGGGTFLGGAFFGSMLAKASGEVDEAVLDAMLSISSTIGAGAAETFGGAAESAYEAVTRAMGQ